MWKAGWILLPPKDGTRLPFPPRISPGTGRYSFQGTSGWTSSHVMCLFWLETAHSGGSDPSCRRGRLSRHTRPALLRERHPGWYDIPSQRVCLYLPHARGKADGGAAPCRMRVWHITVSESLQVTSIWMLFWMTSSTDAEKKYGMRFSGWRLQTKTDIRVATEEYLARMAEAGTDQSLWDGIVTAFRNLLNWASAWKSAQGN